MIGSVRLKGIALASLALVMGGCISVLPDPQPADLVYRLQAPAAAVSANEDAIVFRVDRPTAPVALFRDDIVVSPDGQTLAIAGNAKWAQAIPDLIQHSLTHELASRPDLIGVLPTSGARTTHRVHLTIRNFEAVYDQGADNAPLVKINYMATVSDASTRNLLGTHSVEHSQRASANTISSIVAAKSNANQAAMNEISDWLVTLKLNS